MSKKNLSLGAILSGWFLAVLCLGFSSRLLEAAQPITDANPMRMPQVGDYGIRIITSNILEITLINSANDVGAQDRGYNWNTTLTNWNFAPGGSYSGPAGSDFQVSAGGSADAVVGVNFKRRPLYAPLDEYDLRVENSLYLTLQAPVPNGAIVTVSNAAQDLWNPGMQFIATNDPLRVTPAIHVNEEGYMPNYSKKAEIGYYMGDGGELPLPPGLGFNIVNASNGAVVYSSNLTVRHDVGFNWATQPYTNVLEADFTSFTNTGWYRVQVPTLGASYPFIIDPGIAAIFARTYELGLYHSRCGYSNTLPYTRFVKGECHEPPAAVPNMGSQWDEVNGVLNEMANEFANQTNPQLLTSVANSLYPFVNTNPVDTHGGHHDAGDYSKYTVDVAQLCHTLLFSVDSFPGVAQLDNLGIPESGDGIPDVLQEALWEIDFLSRLQDSDGGFYFLVYPQTEQYEASASLTGTNLGDPQCVFPKTTSATAAAVGALAEAGSSPYMKKYYPTNAANYLAKAELGWQFLQSAISKYGRLGSYQTIQQYGNAYTNQDLLAWAAAALYAATGNTAYEQDLTNNFNPNDPNTQFWSWWGMYEGWGCAIRDYAFAARSGRLQPSQLDPNYLAACESQIIECADTNVAWANDNSYRNGLADEYKSPNWDAGWLFSVNQNFDIAVALAITNKPTYIPAMLGNMNYEAGCNPVNMPFLTGIGTKRQRQIVSQYADCSFRDLPPTGIPVGSVQGGFVNQGPYYGQLAGLTYPGDGAGSGYLPYDRWGDTFNTETEQVSWQQGRSLAAEAYLMAITGYTNQSWQYAVGTITGLPGTVTNGVSVNISLSVSGLNMSNATYVWEATGQDPTPGATFALTPNTAGSNWIEVEALLPDGRRVFATNAFEVQNSCIPNAYLSSEHTPDSTMVALYHLDNSWADSSGNNQPALVPSGNAAFDPNNICWMADPFGASLASVNTGDQAVAQLPSSAIWNNATWKISVEAMIYINSYLGNGQDILALGNQNNNWASTLELWDDPYTPYQAFRAGGTSVATVSSFANALTPGAWHHLSLSLSTNQYIMEVDGTNVCVVPVSSSALALWANNGAIHPLTIGNFDGWIDEVVVHNYTTNPVVVTGGPGTAGTPAVSVSAPAETYVAGANIALSATASVANSSIAGVTFFANGSSLGTVTSAPYTLTWDNVAAGTYSVTAEAVSAAGTAGTSSPLSVTVGSGLITVTAPTISPTGGTFTNSATVTLNVPIGAAVYYTTDGTTPTTSSMLYSGPFTISASATVQALASLGSAFSAVTSAQFTLAQPTVAGTLQSPWQQLDIGAVGQTGSASSSGTTFTVSGSGADVWGTADAFHYVYVPLNGNGQIVAQVTGIQPTDPWAKAGVMFRQSLDAGSAQAYLLLSASNGVAFQERPSEGAATQEPNVVAGDYAPYWLKLARAGNVFSGSTSPDGTHWSSIGSTTVTMTSNIYVGLGVTAHNAADLCASTFGGVQVTGGNGVAILSTVLNADHSITISFSGTANITYYVQALSFISSPAAWQTISTNVADGNGLWQYTDNNTAGFQRRFYRAALP